jgi:hypothetical protein
MSNQLNIKRRALEMFQTGRGADCVIEVVTQIDGQQDPEKKVFLNFTLILLVHSSRLYHLIM